MRIMQRLLGMLVVAALGASVTQAQKVATTSMQFLKVMPCARATALGDAYSVWAQGAEALFWNPAGLAYVRNQELSSTYTLWMMDTHLGALAGAVALGDVGSLGVSAVYVDYGAMEEAIWAQPYIKGYPYPGLTGRTFRPYAIVAGVSYARRLTSRFAVGLTVKYAYESLFNGDMATAMIRQGVFEEVRTWGNGVLFDFGMHYDTGFKTVQVALAVQNFGPTITYAKEASPVPLQFRWGIAADLVGVDALLLDDDKNRFGIAFDLFQPNDYAQQEHVGVEYQFAGTFALRAGYKFNYDAEGLTLGGGVSHTFGTVRLTFDYSYGSVDFTLGDVQRISLGVGLE